jgi:hypothetical protein
MPRDASGNYTLPLADVVTGTTITATWANTTLNDIKTTLTDSLSRSGDGDLTAALGLVDGTSILPSLTFLNETNTGLYRAGTNDMRVTLNGTDIARFYDPGGAPTITLTGDTTITGATTLTGDLEISSSGTPAISYELQLTHDDPAEGGGGYRLFSQDTGTANLLALTPIDYTLGDSGVTLYTSLAGTLQLFNFTTTGVLQLPNAPVGDGDATRKDYVDAKTPVAGGHIYGIFDSIADYGGFGISGYALSVEDGTDTVVTITLATPVADTLLTNISIAANQWSSPKQPILVTTHWTSTSTIELRLFKGSSLTRQTNFMNGSEIWWSVVDYN